MPPKRQIVDAARRLRRALTPPEAALWQWLRERPDGFQFRRQHPVRPFVLDFYCASARWAIEVDGGFHDSAEQVAHDRRRDAWLRAQPIRVLRLKAIDVLGHFEDVTVHILHPCSAFPLHHPSDGPPPPAARGED